MSAAPPAVNDLERLLERAAGGDSEAQREFNRRLPEARLWVVGRAAGRQVEVFRAEFPDGGPFVPAYTSFERLQAAGLDQQPHLAVPGRIVFKARPAEVPVVLNPGVWHGKVMTPGDIEALLSPDGLRTEAMGAGQTLYLGEPAVYPQELALALSEYFRTRREVVEARLAQVASSSSQSPPHPIVGVRVEPGADLRSALAGADQVVRDHHQGEVDFVSLGEGAGRWLEENAEPFYRRDL